MRYAIDLIDAIALAQGTRSLRDVLNDCRLPDDALLTTESDLRTVLLEHLVPSDVDAVMINLHKLMRDKR